MNIDKIALLICVNFFVATNLAAETIVSSKRIKNTISSFDKCDSLVLVSVDKSRINQGLPTRSKRDTNKLAIQVLPTFYSVPALENATITNRDSIRSAKNLILTNLNYKPKAIAACVSWVGSVFIFKKKTYIRVDFDDLNGYLSFAKNGKTYYAYITPDTWHKLMTNALGYNSIAVGPCHQVDTGSDNRVTSLCGNDASR